MKKIILLLLVTFLTGCIESPLLNHADADTQSTNQPQQNTACPLFFPVAGLCASISWEKPPVKYEYLSYTLRFWDAKTGTESGPYVTPAFPVFSELFMPAHGHGSEDILTETVKDSGNQPIPGVYRASNVMFSMRGKWELWIKLLDGTKTPEQAKLEYAI